MYYLQSRYYDPAIGRFINADSYASTGQGIIGNNMFAYCGNSPVARCDAGGQAFENSNNTEFYHACALNDTYGGVGGVAVPVFLCPVDIAQIVKTWALTSSGTTEYRDNSVYVLYDPQNNNCIMYVGRTNDPVRREGEHRNDRRHSERRYYRMKVLVSGLTIEEAKLLEQVLISAFTLTYLDNARREIAVGNIPKYSSYMNAVASIIEGAAEDQLLGMIGG